jgi:hypothetical protein
MFGTSAEVVRAMAMMGKVIDSEPVTEMTRILVDDAKQNQGHQMRMIRQKTN